MSWPDGIKRGSRPKHLWDLHTQGCKKCGMPRYGVLAFPEQLYGCSVSRAEYKQRARGASNRPYDADKGTL
jgi:hypothetical protein